MTKKYKWRVKRKQLKHYNSTSKKQLFCLKYIHLILMFIKTHYILQFLKNIFIMEDIKLYRQIQLA